MGLIALEHPFLFWVPLRPHCRFVRLSGTKAYHKGVHYTAQQATVTGDSTPLDLKKECISLKIAIRYSVYITSKELKLVKFLTATISFI